jgi:hypothetical protein
MSVVEGCLNLPRGPASWADARGQPFIADDAEVWLGHRLTCFGGLSSSSPGSHFQLIMHKQFQMTFPSLKK